MPYRWARSGPSGNCWKACAVSILANPWCFPQSPRQDSNWPGKQPGSPTMSFIFHSIFRAAIRRTLARVDPALVIIAETEIWPNFLRKCRHRKITVMMVNGRISDRSFPRYRWIRRWLKTVLNDYSVLGMQSEVDRERIESLGAGREKVRVFGNLKYDVLSGLHPLESNLTRLTRMPVSRYGSQPAPLPRARQTRQMKKSRCSRRLRY